MSNAFVINYGTAQIILGGDMEEENWCELIKSEKCPEFRPCVVKVSHHGSTTGRIAGMWGASGFLGKHRPVCVITPWQGGGRKLPCLSDLDEIVDSSAATYITGAQRHRIIDRLSRVQFRISQEGNVRCVFKSGSVQKYVP